MTIFEWAIEFCKQRGMLEANATTVVEKVILHPATAGIRERWGDSFESYPEPLQKLLVKVICECAVQWIELEDPRAYYKPLFDGSVPN